MYAEGIITTSQLKVVVESSVTEQPFFKISTYDVDVLISKYKINECEVVFPKATIVSIEDARAIHDALEEFLERVDKYNKTRKEVDE